MTQRDGWRRTGADADAGSAACRPPDARTCLRLKAAGKALRPWIEVALPHPDVLANRFKEAEFAADLFAVDAGHASATIMRRRQSFFRITFLTEGLKRVLRGGLQRLARPGGDPVIGLQTAFGGGKTHTMLAVYHLAKAARPRRALARHVAALVGKVGVDGMEAPAGSRCSSAPPKGTDVSLKLKDGPQVHTLWGYIAWRLAGDAGPEAGRRGRGGAHQSRLGTDGRGVPARRAERDPARRAGGVRAAACRTTGSRRSCRSSSR